MIEKEYFIKIRLSMFARVDILHSGGQFYLSNEALHFVIVKRPKIVIGFEWIETSGEWKESEE